MQISRPFLAIITGGRDGFVEFWHPRTFNKIPNKTLNHSKRVTDAFHKDVGVVTEDRTRARLQRAAEQKKGKKGKLTSHDREMSALDEALSRLPPPPQSEEAEIAMPPSKTKSGVSGSGKLVDGGVWVTCLATCEALDYLLVGASDRSISFYDLSSPHPDLIFRMQSYRHQIRDEMSSKEWGGSEWKHCVQGSRHTRGDRGSTTSSQVRQLSDSVRS